MLPEIGHFALILALLIAAMQCVLPMYGSFKRDTTLILMAKPMVIAQAVLIFLAFIILEIALVSNDFSVKYVALNSNSHLPLFYKITALWAAHEGSLLLWTTILALWSLLVACVKTSIDAIFKARVLAVMGFLSAGFLAFMLFTSNPFLRYLPMVPFDGNDLNPLLQDPGLVIHPPMLYMGYVGMSVAFSFAIAALIAGKLDAAWAKWSLPWTIAAWCFLTFGITLGSWWSYRDLGWGGWWFWDPVENASFMPWLVATALIHSLIVTEKRGAFKNWTVLLAILTFTLSLLGTFLVRSGILTSVHAFAVDPTRGAFLLEYLGTVVMVALLFYAWRAPGIGQGGSFDYLSRESFLLANNVLLFVLMATVLLGTLYPLVLQVMDIAKISVGPPYFNAVFVPLGCVLLFLMGLGPLAQWRGMAFKALILRAWLSLTLAIAFALSVPWFMTQQLNFTVVLGLTFAAWIFLSVIQDTLWRARLRGSIKILPQTHWAMFFAHIGVAITIAGITLTTQYETSQELSISQGQSIDVGSYHLQLQDVTQAQGPNYDADQAHFALMEHGTTISNLVAEKRYYPVSKGVMSIPAIDVSLWRDVYVALGDADASNQSLQLRVYVKPFVRWIWLGGLFMVLGGVVALWPKRRKTVIA